MDLFNLISALNPIVIKTGTLPHTTHEVPLLTVIASRQIDMDEPAATSESSGAPSTIERSPLDFSNENPLEQINEGDGAEDQGLETMASVVLPDGPLSTMGAAPNIVEEEETDADAPLVSKRRHKRANEESNANASRKVLRKDFDASHPTQSTIRGKSLASIRLGASSTVSAPATRDSGRCNESRPNIVREALVRPGARYCPQEAKLLRKSVAQVARWDQRIQAMEGEKKNLETLLEAEADMRKATEAKNAELVKEMESLRAQFIELQVSRDGLSHQVSTLQAQVTGEEKIKAAFEEFKKYEDERVSARCAEMDSRLDALSIDFDEELYPHMLTAIAGHRWVIGHGLRLAVLKCAESLELRQTFANVVFAGITKGFCDRLEYGAEQGEAKLDLAMVEGYDLKAEGKFIATMQAMKDLKYPLIDELEKLRDAPMDLKIPVYLEVRDPQDPWAVKEEMLLEDAIATNVSRADKKKKCRIVYPTHGVGSAHHARSDGVPVSVHITVSQGLAILLVDAATQIDVPEEESSPKLTTSKSPPSMYNLDWL
ncbi:hypothetical protein Tco_0270994, partial [Tanacetum coccineum]